VTATKITKKMNLLDYNPTMRSIAPTRIPNIDVDAESIPRRIYPAIAPILRGMYVRLRFNLRTARKDLALGEIAGLFCFIRTIDIHISLPAGSLAGYAEGISRVTI
jgi:hypothetical protein